MESKLNVAGMHCSSCEMLLKDSVGEIPNAKIVSINHKNGETIVRHDSAETLEKIKKAIQKEGYKVQ